MVVSSDFYQIFDECADRLNGGESVQDCLKSYPEFLNNLEPLPKEVDEIRTQKIFEPNEAAKTKG